MFVPQQKDCKLQECEDVFQLSRLANQSESFDGAIVQSFWSGRTPTCVQLQRQNSGGVSEKCARGIPVRTKMNARVKPRDQFVKEVLGARHVWIRRAAPPGHLWLKFADYP